MKKRLGLAAVLAASALVVAGCTGGPGEAPTSTPEPPAEPSVYPLSAAWLDDGRSLAVVTWGSSSCVPDVAEVSADGQNIAVRFADEGFDACTDDFAPRGHLVSVPEGVDPTEDVEIGVADPVAPNAQPRTTLRGNGALTGQPGEGTDFEPSAGWFDGAEYGAGVALLTWGSSTCPIRIDDVTAGDEGPVLSITEDTGPCTMDMAPRLTIVGFDGSPEEGAVLTLSGGGFDDVRVPILDN